MFRVRSVTHTQLVHKLRPKLEHEFRPDRLNLWLAQI